MRRFCCNTGVRFGVFNSGFAYVGLTIANQPTNVCLNQMFGKVWRGRALANSGDEDGAREAFDKSQEAGGRGQGAWRRDKTPRPRGKAL